MSPLDTPNGRRSRLALLGLAVALLVLAVFSPAFGADFVNWDDHINMGDLRARDGVPWSFFVRPGNVDPYQPLAWTSFCIDYALWGLDAGFDAPQAGRFHATSVVLHALAAVACLFVARRVLALARPDVRPASLDVAAALAAVLFAIHPLRCESVAWVTERRDVLSGLFYLLALHAWLRSRPTGEDRVIDTRAAVLATAAAGLAVALFLGSLRFDGPELSVRGLGAFGLALAALAVAASTFFAGRALGLHGERRRALGLCSLFFALALASKGLTVVLPATLVALDAWPLRRLRGPSLVAAGIEKLPLFALAAASARLSMWAQAATGKTLVDWETHGLGERILQAFHGLGFYSSRTLVPLPTSPSEFLPDTLSLGEPRFLVPLLAVGALAVAAALLRRRAPWLALAGFTFAASAAPVLGLSQAGPQLVADRYSYLPGISLAVLLAGGWLALHERRGRAPALALALVAVAGLAWTTHARTRVWHDGVSLWRHAIAVDPDDGFAHAQLGSALVIQAGEAERSAATAELRHEADRLFRRSIELDPTPLPGSLMYHGYNLVALGRVDEGIAVLEAHLRDFPDDTGALTVLGGAYGALQRFDEARRVLERASSRPDAHARTWNLLARVRESLGDRAGAISAYETLLARWPATPGARERLDNLRSGR